MAQLNDSLAWLVALGAGLVLFLCMMFLTRNLNWWWLKWVLRLVPAVALLLPVTVPGQPGFYAPAFLVAPFEAFLQADGQPDEAIARLLLVSCALLGLITLVAIARWLRNRTAVSATDPASDSASASGPASPESTAATSGREPRERQEPQVS